MMVCIYNLPSPFALMLFGPRSSKVQACGASVFRLRPRLQMSKFCRLELLAASCRALHIKLATEDAPVPPGLVPPPEAGGRSEHLQCKTVLCCEDGAC